MGKKKKPLPPRVKRMNRKGRLSSARKWLPNYSGKNVLKGYCKHFGVDWRCASIELRMLGVKLDPGYLAMREKTDAERARQKLERREQAAENHAHWHPYTEPFEAYLAGDFAALHDLEQRRDAEDFSHSEGDEIPF